MEEKCEKIEIFLKDEFPGSEVVYKDIDFNFVFRVTFDNKVLILKISREFHDDNTSEEILRKLRTWEVPKELAEHRNMGILITSNGLGTFERS